MGKEVGFVQQLVIVIATAVVLFTEQSAAYGPGDFVSLSRRGQYHSIRTPWHDQLGRYCPRFGLNNEVVLPLPKPTGYTGSDAYKISLLFGREKYGTPWLFVIGRKGSDVPMIDVNLRYAGGDLLGVTAKIVPMPGKYLAEHESIRSNFSDPERWPKHVLVRYNWEQDSELDVAGGLYVLFGSGFVLAVVMALHILQSSKEKISRFIKETVIEGASAEGVPKAD